MTRLDSYTSSWPRWPFLTTAAIGLTLAALAVASHSTAKSHKVDGVRATVKHRTHSAKHTRSAMGKEHGAKVNHGTLSVKGGDRGDAIALRLKAGDPSRIQVDVGDDGSADFTFARAGISAISVKGGDGNDSLRVDDANGAFTDTIPTTISGGDGSDMLLGGQVQPVAENERYKAGDGNDLVDGGKGNDTAYLGDGTDTFRWDNGEGSDVIEGQDGTDTMLFNGAAVAEQATLTANGGRLTFFRVQGNVTMDTNDVEIVDDNAIGGADSVTVNDLTGTDVTQTNIDLAGAFGGNAGDGAVDSVVVNGTNGDDNIAITGNGSGADVTGLATTVSVKHADLTDTLSVNTLAGTDHVATNGVAGLIQVFVDGAAV
jgi:Ca2+-binding RTX toxin-like protein